MFTLSLIKLLHYPEIRVSVKNLSLAIYQKFPMKSPLPRFLILNETQYTLSKL